MLDKKWVTLVSPSHPKHFFNDLNIIGPPPHNHASQQPASKHTLVENPFF
jgi:hypothetical protein